jgi:hypothetical protein
MIKKPDAELAGRIIKNFTEKKLINERLLKKLQDGYIKGNLTEEDWKMLIMEEEVKDEQQN